MPEKFDIVRILGVGTIGLGFLLAFFAFRLLNREQSIARPREKILKAITGFMIFALALCVIGLSSELYRIYRAPSNTQNSTPERYRSFTELSVEELRPAEEAANSFLRQLDEGRDEEAYHNSSNALKKVVSLSEFKEHSAFYLKTFGRNTDRKFHSALKGIGEASGGYTMLYYITFVSSYEDVPNTAETVRLIKTDDETFKVAGYHKQ
jgi:hypothetical protein